MEWQEQKTKCLQKYKDILVMEQDRDVSLTLCGVTPDLQKVYKTLTDFLDDRGVRQYGITLPKALHPLFKDYLEKATYSAGIRLEDFSTDDTEHKVDIHVQSSTMYLIIFFFVLYTGTLWTLYISPSENVENKTFC